MDAQIAKLLASTFKQELMRTGLRSSDSVARDVLDRYRVPSDTGALILDEFASVAEEDITKTPHAMSLPSSFEQAVETYIA